MCFQLFPLKNNYKTTEQWQQKLMQFNVQKRKSSNKRLQIAIKVWILDRKRKEERGNV